MKSSSQRVSKRTNRRSRWSKPSLVILAGLVMLGTGLVAVFRAPANSSPVLFSITEKPFEWSSGSMSLNQVMAVAGGGHGRTVYPYSVVPGGVRTPAELSEAAAHDQTVATHYAGFDFTRARVIELPAAKLVYVSYRIRDKIYWTKNKIRLAKGEKLITDGKMTARTRCANRVSEAAQKAVSPQEPAAASLEEPVGSGDGAVITPLPGTFESALLPWTWPEGFGQVGSGDVPRPGLPIAGLPTPSSGPIGGGAPPPAYPPPPQTPPPTTPPTTPPPPTPVPETVPGPGIMLLLVGAVFAFYLRHRKVVA